MEDLQELDYTLNFLKQIGLGVDDVSMPSLHRVVGQVFNSKNASNIFGYVIYCKIK